MKQTILNQELFERAEACSSRIALVWGAYGCAMALLTRFVGASALDQILLWSAAGAMGLLLAGREI